MTAFVLVGFVILLLFVAVRCAVFLKKARPLPLGRGLILFFVPLFLVPLGAASDSALLSVDRGVSLEQGDPRLDLTTRFQAAVNPFLRKAAPKPVPRDGVVPVRGPIVLDRKNYYRAYQELYSAPEAFAGRTIQVTGFVYRHSTGSGKQLIIARALMWCCAADAVTIGFVAASPEATSLTDAKWVSVTGTLATTTYVNQYTHLASIVPLVQVKRIDRMRGPDFAFVFPN